MDPGIRALVRQFQHTDWKDPDQKAKAFAAFDALNNAQQDTVLIELAKSARIPIPITE